MTQLTPRQCAPIWLGERSSVCTHVIERLYGNSSRLNDPEHR